MVPADIYQWAEVATESVDVVLSNQTFEHVPLFWITTAEVAPGAPDPVEAGLHRRP